MTIPKDLVDVVNELYEIRLQLTDISTGINNKPECKFTMRVASVLTSDMYDDEKLTCIKLLYAQMAWPERSLNAEQLALLDKIK